MKIYLVGFMGAGKSTVGAEVARRLDLPFIDLDELIVSAEAMAIKEIFAEKGEPYFRKRERDMLWMTQYVESAVIATGGGTFTFDDNIQFIRAHGYSVYLSAPLPLLWSRIGDKAAERPMFRDDLALHELHQHRLPCYRLADATVEVREGESVEEVSARLIMLLPKEVLGGLRRGGVRV